VTISHSSQEQDNFTAEPEEEAPYFGLSLLKHFKIHSIEKSLKPGSHLPHDMTTLT